MFTDIVGYTAIMQNNESFAMQVLQRHNQMMRPVFLKHNGKEIKTIGDSFLVEFESALEAVLCAVDIQSLLHSYNKASGATWKFNIRIGIHLGDVIHRENDVFGDAVNIASRIRPLAEPGGICVSEQVYYQVRNKIPHELLKLEHADLKNVIYSLEVYKVSLAWKTRAEAVSQTPAIPFKKRLAVLPLSNMSPDPQDEYFADGMTEELITVLSNIKDLRVIARTSVMRYKGSNRSIAEIGKELNVGSILEGSIRKIGNRVRVNVQVVDAANEEHVWANIYDREIGDIFTVQSDIARQVSRSLKAKLHAIEKERIRKKPTESIDAYTLYLKGRFALHGRNKQAFEEAMHFFEAAISKDPGYARAYAGLADSLLIIGSYGYQDPKVAYPKARDHVSRALELDENLSEAHASLGLLLETYYYDFSAAKAEFEHAISLNPSYAQARHWYAINLSIFDRVDEAIVELEKARDADPLSPQIGTVLGGLYLYRGRDEDALKTWENVLMSNPDNVPLYLNRGVYYAKMSRKEEALADIDKALGLSSGSAVVKCLLGYVYAALGQRDEALAILEEIRMSSQQEYVSPFHLSMVYAGLGDTEKSIQAIEKAIDDRSAEIESLLHDSLFEHVRADSKFSALLERIGLSSKVSQKAQARVA